MLEVLLFLCQYWTFLLNLLDLNIHTTINRITLKLCQVAFHIKNSVFIIYLLEEEQELSAGMLDTSPAYLNFFDCSMLYYIMFWTLFGFIIHFYIIFGTNLLTAGPAQNFCFCLFQSFAEKEYQTESKRNETFGNVIFGTSMIQRTWTLRQDINQEATR